MLFHLDGSTPRGCVGERSCPRRAPILDDLVIEALRPLEVLQIGRRGQVLEGDCGAAAVRQARSLHEAVGILAEHEFDAIVLGAGLADAWPTAAYEQIAKLAGRTPVLVQTDYIGPLISLKQQQARDQDIVVSTANPSLLARLILAAVLRRRALAEEPGAQIG
jgi:DNA-binding NarL/FixJ family response regulator